MTDSSMYNYDELEQRLGALARTMTEEDRRLEQPPADLFSSIVAELRNDAEAEPQPGYHSVVQHSGVQHSGVQNSTNADRVPSENNHQVTNIAEHRQARADEGSSRGWLLAAAAAVALLLIGGAVLSSGLLSSDSSGDVVASANIVNDELPVTFNQAGTAVLRSNNGDLVLDIDVPDLPDSGQAFYEVWMIDTNVEGMISLGVLSADGQIDVPDSIDPADFPVVDVSVEPLDGDPTHSGQSILRGVLEL